MNTKKVFTAFLAAILLAGALSLSALAADWGEGDTLDDALSELKVGFADERLDWLSLPVLGVVKLRYTYFLYKNDRSGTLDEHPVYCVDPTKGGAKEIVDAVGPNPDDGSDTATYIRGEKVGDPKYRGIMGAGYPHKRYTGLGLQTREEAYYATKLALWMYIRGSDPSTLTINPAYGDGDPVALRVRAAAVSIYNSGVRGSTYEPELTLKGKPNNMAELDAAGESYVQGIEVFANGWIGTNPDVSGDVQLAWESAPPAGTVVLGTNGEDITNTMRVVMNTQSGQLGWYGRVTVKYPAPGIDAKTFSPPTLTASALLPGSEIYVAYAKVNRDQYQRYLVERDPKAALAASFVSQLADTGKSSGNNSLRIRKLETGTNEPLAGAVFAIRDPDGTLIYSLATDEDGLIDVPLYVVGNYTVTELVPPRGHLLPAVRTQSVYVRYGETAEVTFENDPYGTLRVTKRDAANGTPLGGAAIKIRRITTNTAREGITDSSGSVVFEKLPVGAYEIVEIAAPDGYALDAAAHTVHVTPLSEGETGYALTNRANPGLRVVKFDRQTMTPIAGVTFAIWRDGALMGSYITDAWGEIVLHNLPAGTYTAREIATVAPYVLDTTVQWIELRAGQGFLSELYFFNLRKPGMRLVKVDSATLKPLPNARFRIARVGGAFSDEYNTDANGEIDLTALEPGAYTITERAAPEGYLMDSMARTIQLNAGERAQFVFTNTKRPEIELIKLDAKTGQPLAGATFRIAKIEGGSRYLDRVTDMDGRIVIGGLDPGVYSARELAAPEGYVKDETGYHVALFPGRTSTLVVSNAHKPDLKIVKRDAKTGVPLAGASFKIRKADGATYATVTTDGLGEAWLYGVDPGVYEAAETLPPPGYLPNAAPQLVTLFPNRTGVVEFTNHKKPGLTVLKVDEMTGLPLAGAEFSVKRKDGSLVWEGLTDARGEIHLSDLQADWYTITELAAPFGYLIANQPKDVKFAPGETVQVKFDNRPRPVLEITKLDAVSRQPIPGTKFRVTKTEGGTTSDYLTGQDGKVTIRNLDAALYTVGEISVPDSHILRPDLQTIALAWGQTKALIYENDKKPKLTITKVDDATKSPLQGAVFNVAIREGRNLGDFTTDSKGEIVFERLDPALYVITEVKAPDGYAITNAPRDIRLMPNGDHTVEFRDKALSPLYIKKVDAATGLPLAGVTYRVTKMNGEFVGECTTDRYGFAVLPRLDPGFYTVTETAVPEGYLLDAMPKSVEVRLGEPATLEFANRPFGRLLIQKVDDKTGGAISGVDFSVTKVDGAFVGDYTTDAHGGILIPSLEPGFYVVRETRAKDGYLLDATPKTVAIQWGQTAGITVRNKAMSSIQIIKIDATDRQPLKGAQFTVYKQSGEIVGTYETNGDGVIILDKLTPGWYKAAETKAPDGYLMDDTPQDFEITADQFVRLVFENRPLSGLNIVKLDASTRQPIEGVAFEIANMSGENVTNGLNGGVFVTDKAGRISIPNLPDGYFTVTETCQKEGYWPDAAPKTVLIQSGRPTVLEVLNTPMSGLLIVKTDKNTGKPLPGAVFDVARADGQRVTGSLLDGNQPGTEANSPNRTTSSNGDVDGSYTTDANGRIQIHGLSAGEYHVVERKAPDGYELDPAVHNVTVTPGRLATLRLTNTPKAGLRLIKIDSVTKKPIYGAEFMIFDSNNKVAGNFTTDADGVIDFAGILTEGRYTLRETRPADGYTRDDVPRTVECKSGQVTEVVWENTPAMGQIQITKLSGDDNEQNGLPKGTPLAGAVFEIYQHKSGNLVDRFVSGADGRAVSKPLPLGRYTVKEAQAPQWYRLSTEALDIEIEFAAQIVRREFLNDSVNTGVTIRKTGNYETMSGDVIPYTIKELRNDSTVPLTDFYWRDVLPTGAVRLTKIVTGSYNQSLKYKAMITTNKGDTRVVADNLSTTRNNVIDCANTALGLARDEYVTSFSLLFGTVKAGFTLVEQPRIYVKVLPALPNRYEFTNKADCGGKYAGAWVAGNAVWRTAVYAPAKKFPRTGY